MRRALASLAAIAILGGCGSEPTAQEENLSNRATGPDQLATGNGTGNAVVPSGAVDDVGSREGIPGATQGPTAGDSDAPASGEDSRPRTY
jgi:hypothetical protein